MSARQRKQRDDRRREHSTRKKLMTAGGLTAGVGLAMTGVAQAAPMTFTVGINTNSSSGGNCTSASNNDCSLREAVGLANANAGADTIVFNSNLSGSTINLTTGQLAITEAVTVDGGTQDATVDGGDTQRIFHVNPGTAGDLVSIESLTLTDGNSSSDNGGAIYNADADLTISDSVISSSDTGIGGYGGGVYTDTGPVTLDGATVTGNSARYGGGLASHFGEVTVTSSTISENYASAYGGGIWTGAADLTVLGSTLSGNDAEQDGGGIYSSFETNGGNGNPVTVGNSTVAGNHAVDDDGGGIWICCGDPGDALTVISSTVTGNTAATTTGGLQVYIDNVSPLLQNSIVSGNTSGTTPATDDVYAEAGHEFASSFSLVGVPSIYVNTAVAGSNLFGQDPQLGTLQDNGGPTYTMEPAAASPVIDCGSDTTHALDQRGIGFPRVVDQPNRTGSTAAGANQADMGALEVAADPLIIGACTNLAPPQPTPTPTPTPTAGPTGQRSAALSKCKRKHRKAVQQKRAQGELTTEVKQNLNKKFRKCKRRANQLPA
jgi:hypothetical protein